MPSLAPPSALLHPPPITLPALTHLSFRRVHPDSLARFIRILVAPFLTGLTLEMRSWDLGKETSMAEVHSLLSDHEFTRRLTILNLFAFAPDIPATFFLPFSNLKTLRLNFHNGLKDEFWATFSDATTMPQLRHLSLVNVPSGHVQELVHSRQLASQPRLESLELLFSSAKDADDASSPAWCVWLASSVLHFKNPRHVDFSAVSVAFEEF
ncbi:hypothetical protein C8R43DRAFT_1123516 [Mycena crocata]|nr:hypothetical protein C8R43DRAFT_1123516 [Mycena crocata]